MVNVKVGFDVLPFLELTANLNKFTLWGILVSMFKKILFEESQKKKIPFCYSI